MDLQTLITWNGMPPEYLLEGLWYITVNNYSNSPTTVPVPKPDFLDPFVTEVTIPQINLSYKKTDFDMINFDDKDEFGSITMTFCDDTKGTCLAFFDNWVKAIFDLKKNCVKSTWRNERKFLTAHLVRILRKADEPVSQSEREAIASGSMNDKFKNLEVKDVASFLISGCYPKGTQEISLSVDSGERYEFSVELECETVNGYYRSRDSDDGLILMSYY